MSYRGFQQLFIHFLKLKIQSVSLTKINIYNPLDLDSIYMRHIRCCKKIMLLYLLRITVFRLVVRNNTNINITMVQYTISLIKINSMKVTSFVQIQSKSSNNKQNITLLNGHWWTYSADTNSYPFYLALSQLYLISRPQSNVAFTLFKPTPSLFYNIQCH